MHCCVKMYQIPSEYKFRIHHIRPRFKNCVESVLLHVASSLAQLEPDRKRVFDQKFDRMLSMFPGNAHKTPKTIANWRTEISSLFGLMIDLNNGTTYAGANATMLAERGDLVEFFKYFLYTFQYPGGHMKAHKTSDIITHGIKFKPARYILELLDEGENVTGSPFWLNSAEATHCVFNDLRVTRDNRDVKEVIKLITKNRKDGVKYDWTGDVIRYAGDVLDYMEYANLLSYHGTKYYLNPVEGEAAQYMTKNDTWFDGFDSFYGTTPDSNEIKKMSNMWFLYVNSYAGKIRFETDLLKYIGGVSGSDYDELANKSVSQIPTMIDMAEELITKYGEGPTTKNIGDAGETLVHGHECATLRNESRDDLIHKVVIIPTHLAMGYDIKSYDAKEDLKHIEVKTTISNKALTVNSFHLTDNEWNTADKLKDKYYVYRLQISRGEQNANVKMIVIRDPVTLFKSGKLRVKSSRGMDVTLRPGSGTRKELLIWKN